MRLRALAPGKVNLGLVLGPVRADGRHELVTAIESVSLADELTLSTGPEITADQVECAAVDGRNLVEDALAALRSAGWSASPVRIEITKRIPVAGGMAGGSADAAAALRMALVLGDVRRGEVSRIAASLGSDVPSQLVPGLVLATGGGEVIEPREPLGDHALVLLPLGSTLPAADVYARADALGLPLIDGELRSRGRELGRAMKRGARLGPEQLVNDLDRAAISLQPEVAEALRAARDVGAEHVFGSGSGPTVAGLFWGEDGVARAGAAARMLVDDYPDAVCVEPVGPDFGMPHPL
jgi:4-diphosphocytidyl-2-C-methyl-D-erythritol kinase